MTLHLIHSAPLRLIDGPLVDAATTLDDLVRQIEIKAAGA